MVALSPADEKRFWSKVARGRSDECWEWQASAIRGYGQFQVRRTMLKAHRLAWLLSGNGIDAGQCVLHKCDNPGCCNPQHLFLGTVGDNNRDRHAKRRDATGARHGSVSHPNAVLRGDAHPSSRVSDETVRKIREEYVPGRITQRALGLRHGLSNQQVSNIVRGAFRRSASEGL